MVEMHGRIDEHVSSLSGRLDEDFLRWMVDAILNETKWHRNVSLLFLTATNGFFFSAMKPATTKNWEEKFYWLLAELFDLNKSWNRYWKMFVLAWKVHAVNRIFDRRKNSSSYSSSLFCAISVCSLLFSINNLLFFCRHERHCYIYGIKKKKV